MLVPAILIVLTFHELAHGLAAYLLGDRTASSSGRLTLNPLAHIDLIGFVCMLIAGIGWAKPVPVSPYNFKIKNKKLGMAITALAGPLANLITTFVFLFIYCIIVIKSPDSAFLMGLASFLEIAAVLSLGLMAFNLLPIPPLDGFNIVLPFVPNKALEFIYKYEQYIRIGFLVLLIFNLLDGVISSVIGWSLNLVLGVIVDILVLVGIM